MSKSRMKKFLTGQKVPDLLDQISQILIALVHFFFGSIGFQQNSLSILFCLICPQFCFRDLCMGDKINGPENDVEKLFRKQNISPSTILYSCIDKVFTIPVPIQQSYIARASI